MAANEHLDGAATGLDSPNAELIDHLRSCVPHGTRTELCQSVLPGILSAIWEITQEFRGSDVSLVGTINAFGDAQLNVDIAAELVMRIALAEWPSVVTSSSEEEPAERPTGPGREPRDGGEQYTVAYDPLDGSSIIGPNWTVGTIVGVWDGPTALGAAPAEKQVAAVLGVYGPRTTAVVALRVPGGTATCLELKLNQGQDGRGVKWEVVRTDVRFEDAEPKTRYFAPANLRAAAEDERYMALISRYIQSNYTLRYCGGLVPDIVHMLVKGHGVYISPVTAVNQAKLRRLYELFPVALIIECAGGLALDPNDGRRVLDRPLEDCDERAGLLCGTTQEVYTASAALLNVIHH